MERRNNHPYKVLGFFLIGSAALFNHPVSCAVTSAELKEHTRQANLIIQAEQLRNSWRVHPKNSYILNQVDTANHHKGYKKKEVDSSDWYINKKHKLGNFHGRTNPLNTYLRFSSYYPPLAYFSKYRSGKKINKNLLKFQENDYHPGDKRSLGNEENYWGHQERRKEKYPVNERGYNRKRPYDRKFKQSAEKSHFFEIPKEHSYPHGQSGEMERGEPEGDNKENGERVLYKVEDKRNSENKYAHNEDAEEKRGSNQDYRPKIIYYNFANKDRRFYGGSKKNDLNEGKDDIGKSKHRVGWHWHDADEGHVGWFWHSPSYKKNHKVDLVDYRNVWQGHNSYHE